MRLLCLRVLPLELESKRFLVFLLYVRRIDAVMNVWEIGSYRRTALICHCLTRVFISTSTTVTYVCGTRAETH
jgi:hypothetical protein